MTCKQCGKEFMGSDRRKYCSSRCYGDANVKPLVHMTCLQCGKEFSRKKRRKYCSSRCVGNAKINPLRKWTPEAKREYTRVYNRTKKYGLTIEQLDVLYEKQQGQCAICQKAFTVPSMFHIDHDHDTGAVRGLLCRYCNYGLGYLWNKELLENAIKYLETP